MKYVFDREESSYLFRYNPQSQQLRYMKPDEFLELTIPEHFMPEALNVDTIELEAKIKSQTPLDPPFLDVDKKSCRVTNHEGRHRAIAAKRVGVKKLPVIVYFREEGYYTKPYGCKKLKSQRF